MRAHERQSMNCRVCGESVDLVLERIVTPNCDDPVPVYRCAGCGHYSLFPNQYQQQKAFQWDGVAYYLRDMVRRETAAAQIIARLRHAYRKLNQRAPGTFLDAGCAIGLALPIAQSEGMQAMGIEPEARLAEYGRSSLQVDVRHGMLSDLDPAEQTFDLIYCEQVLEHVDQPAQFLAELKQLLAPNGLIYIGRPTGVPA